MAAIGAATAPFQLLLQQHGEESVRIELHLLTLRGCQAHPTVRVVYKEPEMKAAHTLLLSGRREIVGYVKAMFGLLTKDTDPFHLVQLLAPAFPSILLPVKELEDPYVCARILRILHLWMGLD